MARSITASSLGRSAVRVTVPGSIVGVGLGAKLDGGLVHLGLAGHVRN